jgi:hypothetical protein
MSEMNSVLRRLDELEAKEAIRQAIYRKARATDRADAEMELRALWADTDYSADMGAAESRAESIKGHVAGSFHCIGNILIEMDEDGQGARVESYVQAYIKTMPDKDSIAHFLGPDYLERPGVDPSVSHDLLIGIRYKDRFAKRDGEWKVESRSLINDWTITQPSTTFTSGVLFDALKLHGTWKPEDASYTEGGVGFGK